MKGENNMSFSTTIKRECWEMKLEDIRRDGFFYEYKDLTEFWETRLNNIVTPTRGVFLVGKDPLWVVVLEISLIRYRDVPERYREYLHTDPVYRLKCVPGVGG